MISIPVARKFIIASLFFLLLGCVEGLLFPTKDTFNSFYATVLDIPPQLVRPFFTEFLARIHTHITLVGWVSSALMGMLYFVVPQISGRERYNGFLCHFQFWVHICGTLLLCIAWHITGTIGLRAGFSPGSPEFADTVAPYRILIYLGGLALLVSSLLFSYNIAVSLAAPGKSHEEDPDQQNR